MDVALERAAEHLLQPARHGHERAEVDAGLDPLSLEQVDEILGRHVAGRAWREGTAAEAADGCVEHMRAGLERGEAVRVARVARVVAVKPRRLCLLDERADRGRRRDADRVGEDDFGPVEEPRRELGYDAWSDAALEGTAERARDRHGRRRLAG